MSVGWVCPVRNDLPRSRLPPSLGWVDDGQPSSFFDVLVVVDGRGRDSACLAAENSLVQQATVSLAARTVNKPAVHQHFQRYGLLHIISAATKPGCAMIAGGGQKTLSSPVSDLWLGWRGHRAQNTTSAAGSLTSLAEAPSINGEAGVLPILPILPTLGNETVAIGGISAPLTTEIHLAKGKFFLCLDIGPRLDPAIAWVSGSKGTTTSPSAVPNHP